MVCSASVESVNLKEDQNTLDNISSNMRKESQRGFSFLVTQKHFDELLSQ